MNTEDYTIRLATEMAQDPLLHRKMSRLDARGEMMDWLTKRCVREMARADALSRELSGANARVTALNALVLKSEGHIKSLKSTLRAILAVTETRDSTAFNIISDAVRLVLKETE